jgi:hypothetical protein
VWGSFNYLHKTIIVGMRMHVMLYEAARLCHPKRMAELRFSAQAVEVLLSNRDLRNFFPVLAEIDSTKLLEQLPAYKVAAEGTQRADPAFTAEDIMPFWAGQQQIPEWYKLACIMATIVPSSASAERVFSIMANTFGEQQAHALQDYRSASCMLQYNKRTC